MKGRRVREGKGRKTGWGRGREGEEGREGGQKVRVREGERREGKGKD